MAAIETGNLIMAFPPALKTIQPRGKVKPGKSVKL
jgi:hypothetical protein